jgi:hypothetical protein
MSLMPRADYVELQDGLMGRGDGQCEKADWAVIWQIYVSSSDPNQPNTYNDLPENVVNKNNLLNSRAIECRRIDQLIDIKDQRAQA